MARLQLETIGLILMSIYLLNDWWISVIIVDHQVKLIKLSALFVVCVMYILNNYWHTLTNREGGKLLREFCINLILGVVIILIGC